MVSEETSRASSLSSCSASPRVCLSSSSCVSVASIDKPNKQQLARNDLAMLLARSFPHALAYAMLVAAITLIICSMPTRVTAQQLQRQHQSITSSAFDGRFECARHTHEGESVADQRLPPRGVKLQSRKPCRGDLRCLSQQQRRGTIDSSTDKGFYTRYHIRVHPRNEHGGHHNITQIPLRVFGSRERDVVEFDLDDPLVCRDPHYCLVSKETVTLDVYVSRVMDEYPMRMLYNRIPYTFFAHRQTEYINETILEQMLKEPLSMADQCSTQHLDFEGRLSGYEAVNLFNQTFRCPINRGTTGWRLQPKHLPDVPTLPDGTIDRNVYNMSDFVNLAPRPMESDIAASSLCDAVYADPIGNDDTFFTSIEPHTGRWPRGVLDCTRLICTPCDAAGIDRAQILQVHGVGPHCAIYEMPSTRSVTFTQVIVRARNVDTGYADQIAGRLASPWDRPRTSFPNARLRLYVAKREFAPYDDVRRSPPMPSGSAIVTCGEWPRYGPNEPIVNPFAAAGASDQLPVPTRRWLQQYGVGRSPDSWFYLPPEDFVKLGREPGQLGVNAAHLFHTSNALSAAMCWPPDGTGSGLVPGDLASTWDQVRLPPREMTPCNITGELNRWSSEATGDPLASFPRHLPPHEFWGDPQCPHAFPVSTSFDPYDNGPRLMVESNRTTFQDKVTYDLLIDVSDALLPLGVGVDNTIFTMTMAGGAHQSSCRVYPDTHYFSVVHLEFCTGTYGSHPSSRQRKRMYTARVECPTDLSLGVLLTQYRTQRNCSGTSTADGNTCVEVDFEADVGSPPHTCSRVMHPIFMLPNVANVPAQPALGAYQPLGTCLVSLYDARFPDVRIGDRVPLLCHTVPAPGKYPNAQHDRVETDDDEYGPDDDECNTANPLFTKCGLQTIVAWMWVGALALAILLACVWLFALYVNR